MCLLVVLFRFHPDAPLVVAANRDEFLARPAISATVLQQRDPRILGGRDELAGGTWLATNEHGVFAGLTNQPTPNRDPAKRSRGELPLALAQFKTAAEAVDAFAADHRPADFSPAWLLVGDRTSLFLVDMTSGERPAITPLEPGIHVLENRAWHAPSAKVRHVRAQLAGIEQLRGDALRTRLAAVLADHAIPDGPADDSGVEGFVRPRETEACCVHAGPYGTRSACVVLAPANGPVRVWSSDGPPCTHPLVDRGALWAAAQDEPALALSVVDRAEDQIALTFYRTLYEAPATLLAVKHSFYFNETYGEAPQDREVLALFDDDALRAEVVRHLDDEVRHATLWRDYLTARGEMPAEGAALPFGDFVGMLRAAGWLPTTARLQSGAPLTAEEQMAFFAIIHVIETQAVRQMILFRRVLRERGERDLDDVISSILQDEGRHMAYSRRALHAIGARAGLSARAHELERIAFRAFLRLRAGDMRKLLQHVFAHDGDALPLRSRMTLRGLAVAIGTMPTRVPGPDGKPTIDAALPL